MKGFVLPLIGILSGLMVFGCQRDRGVYAGNETYQPRPARTARKPVIQDIHGELVRLDLPKNLFVLRVSNGMEQTFEFDDSTYVMGLRQSKLPVRDLVGKEGSEVIVEWEEVDGIKKAQRIDVTQLSTSKASQRRRGH
jgi:hypothetical protein